MIPYEKMKDRILFVTLKISLWVVLCGNGKNLCWVTKYIMGIDVSRGDSEDFTTFCIIDFDEREQVLEYLGKIPPDVAAESRI